MDRLNGMPEWAKRQHREMSQEWEREKARHEGAKKFLLGRMKELLTTGCPHKDEYDCPFFDGAHDVCNRGSSNCLCPVFNKEVR